MPSTKKESLSVFIPEFNTIEDRKRSRQVLREMGFERFDEFEYVVR